VTPGCHAPAFLERAQFLGGNTCRSRTVPPPRRPWSDEREVRFGLTTPHPFHGMDCPYGVSSSPKKDRPLRCNCLERWQTGFPGFPTPLDFSAAQRLGNYTFPRSDRPTGRTPPASNALSGVLQFLTARFSLPLVNRRSFVVQPSGCRGASARHKPARQTDGGSWLQHAIWKSRRFPFRASGAAAYG
jgi:hypothetical protein